MTAPEAARVAGEVRVAVGRLSRQLRRLYAEGRAEQEPSFLELAVLQRLERSGPASVSQLASGERVTTQAISLIIAGLRRLDLVRTRTDPGDRRRTLVEVTETGSQVLVSREARIQGRLSEVIAAECSVAEVQLLQQSAALLDRLAQHL